MLSFSIFDRRSKNKRNFKKQMVPRPLPIFGGIVLSEYRSTSTTRKRDRKTSQEYQYPHTSPSSKSKIRSIRTRPRSKRQFERYHFGTWTAHEQNLSVPAIFLFFFQTRLKYIFNRFDGVPVS